MTTQIETNEICCPKFDPSLWDNKILEWENKRFIKDDVCTLFYMPVNFGGAMIRWHKLVSNSGAAVQDYLCLSDHRSKWKMDLYLAVDQEISGTQNVIWSGKYFCKVYEGAFRNTGKWCKDYKESLKERGLNLGKLYMWYTTCPKCAKKYGKNYVAILSQIE